MVLSYSFCNVSVLPVRKEPSHQSEQVTQMLFGEKAEILEVDGNDWARIRTDWDDYEGWCRVSQLGLLQRKEYSKERKFLSGRNSDTIKFEGSESWLPLGSEIMRSKLLVNGQTGKFKGKKVAISELSPSGEALRTAALSYLHAPYLWGGRSIAGIDCSGLSQMAYKLCNVRIPRDASVQATAGTVVDFLQHAACGDLAFFDNTEGRINHVGMLLDHQTIIHATETSGRVVIDRIDQGGIISKSLRKRTHNLRMVRRYF
ncbi:MAG: hypothetical protein EOP49_02810 [Sphingobacteriales bacterium]|nr:MAG: hypothetical protein EOP49_02810 [Sphingobacteriales bacterium]